jgi:hypothetical protein
MFEEESMNEISIFCSNCGRPFRWRTEQVIGQLEPIFDGWEPCECGQDRPVIEERLGLKPESETRNPSTTPAAKGEPDQPGNQPEGGTAT